ncbi:hypothetical protein TYRP_014540, partial [Tyrophagus putrescentiae]
RCTDKNGEVWRDLTHQERPLTRVSRAERARSESVGVHSAQVSSGKILNHADNYDLKMPEIFLQL